MGHHASSGTLDHLGDLTTTRRVLPISGLAVAIGVFCRPGRRGAPQADRSTPRHLRDVIEHQPVVAYEDEPLRVIVFRMAETGLTRLPVIARRDGTLVDMLALTDLLIARARLLEAEQRRERVLGGRLRLFDMFGRGRAA